MPKNFNPTTQTQTRFPCNRQQQGAGLVVGCAEDDRSTAFSQLDQERIGPCDAVRMDDNGSDLVERHEAECLAVLFDLQEATVPRQMAAILANVYDLIQHRTR